MHFRGLEARAHQLQRDVLVKLAIGAFGEENPPHAALTEQAQQAIRADARIDECLIVIEQ